jgi:uncharacterized protein
MNEKIIEEVRKFVEEECKKPTSKYGYEPFVNHFVPVVDLVNQLGKVISYKGEDVDLEVLEISAWLHDIGSILCGREDHHITGAEIAEKKLRELNYPEEKIEKVKLCILNHRGSKESENKRDFIEAIILAEADAIDSFNRIPILFKAALIYENKTQEEAKNSVRQKLERKWNQLSLEESKKLIKPKYDAAMLLLGD